jgi:predicted RNA-binding Zn-ribbon protein involved in translation (DUF1610 family)
MDIATISTAITALKSATGIIQALSDMNKGAEINQKAIELQSIILGLQGNLLELQAQVSELLDKKRELERKIGDQDAWVGMEKEYHLTEITSGQYIYASSTQKPGHWLCPNCFDKKKKSILQERDQRQHGKFYRCHDCTLSFSIR